jgi:hypothetical protein
MLEFDNNTLANMMTALDLGCKHLSGDFYTVQNRTRVSDAVVSAASSGKRTLAQFIDVALHEVVTVKTSKQPAVQVLIGGNAASNVLSRKTGLGAGSGRLSCQRAISTEHLAAFDGLQCVKVLAVSGACGIPNHGSARIGRSENRTVHFAEEPTPNLRRATSIASAGGSALHHHEEK